MSTSFRITQVTIVNSLMKIRVSTLPVECAYESMCALPVAAPFCIQSYQGTYEEANRNSVWKGDANGESHFKYNTKDAADTQILILRLIASTHLMVLI